MKIRWRKDGRILIINVTTYLYVLSQIKLLELLQKFTIIKVRIVINNVIKHVYNLFYIIFIIQIKLLVIITFIIQIKLLVLFIFIY